MFYQASLFSTPNATSSPESGSGATPCDKQDGQMTGQSGQEVALVNLSARQAKEQGLLTSGIYGLHSTGSSASVNLMLFLASKLRARTASIGSTLFGLTWKQRTTPSGRSICALRASALRTSGSDYTSWPSPLANKNSPQQRDDFTPNLAAVAQLTSWATPKSATGAYQYGNGDPNKIILNLEGQARLTSWATPTQRDHKDGDCSQRQANGHQVTLQDQVLLTASGETPNGSTAETANGGQLNPALARWLMGLPSAWCEAAIRAHRSMRTTRRKPARSGSKDTATA